MTNDHKSHDLVVVRKGVFSKDGIRLYSLIVRFHVIPNQPLLKLKDMEACHGKVKPK